MASFIYNSCLRDTFRGRINFETDAFRMLLVTAAYHPDKDGHSRRSDIEGEAEGQGYTPGGVSADIRVGMVDDALTLGLGSVKLSAASVAARYAVYFVDRGSPEDDELVALIDFGGDVTSTNGDYSVTTSQMKIQN